MVQMHRCSIWITHRSDPDSLEAVQCLFHRAAAAASTKHNTALKKLRAEGKYLRGPIHQQLVSVFAPFSPYLMDLFISGYLTKLANQCYTVEPRPPREDNSYWTVQLTGSADKCRWDKLDWAFPVSWGCIGGQGHFQESKGNKRNADFESLWFTLWAENFKFANPFNLLQSIR